MRYRKLQITWSVAWGLVALLLLVFWVRSYWMADTLHAGAPILGQLDIESSGGRLIASREATTDATYWECDSFRRGKDWDLELDNVTVDWAHDGVVNVPYWLVAMLPCVFIAAPWLPLRFSIRTLLIATTLVALVLGLAIYAARN